MDVSRRPAFEVSQRQWMENYQGTTAPFLSDKDCTEAKLLGAETLEQRRIWIEGRAETGLHEPIVQPFSVWRDAKPGEWGLTLDLARFEKPSLPGDHLFNSAIARFEKDALNNYPAGAPADAGVSLPYEYSATVRITYASPRIISARINGSEDGGGAHPIYPTHGVTIDRQAGTEINFMDLFDFNAIAPLEKDCARQIGKTTSKNLDKDQKEALHKGVADLHHWHFTVDGATLVFGDYEVGSFADGHPSCHLPLAMLKKLARPGAPLPEEAPAK